MSTLKFKEESPYTMPPPTAPEEDYLYFKFLRDLTLTNESGAKPVGVALFGAGRAGTIHLHSLAKNPRVKVLYLVEEMTEKWEKLKIYWNLEQTIFLKHADADKVYNDPNVVGVIVTTPTDFHEEIVTKALEGQKYVFCEKPIAANVESTKRCYEKSRQTGKPLLAGFNRRFDPSYSTAKLNVDRGEVGHVRMFKSSSKDSGVPPLNYLAKSGGIFNDMAIHDLDLMVWFVGEYPTTVSAVMKTNIPEIKAIGDYDTGVITFGFPSGAVGIIDLCRHCNYGHDQRIEVFGSKGVITIDNQRPSHGLEIQTDFRGPRKTPIWFAFSSRYRDAYTNEMEHFVDICQGKEKQPLVEEKDVLATSKLAAACMESAKTGKIVTLEW